MDSIHTGLPGSSYAPADSNVQIGDNSIASIKLDVMTSKQFNILTIINVVLWGYTLLHVTFLSVACNTIWYLPQPRKNVNGIEIDAGMCWPPTIYTTTIYVVDIIAGSALILLCIAFTVRVCTTHIHRSREQIWTLVMLLMSAISYNPSDPLVFLHDYILSSSYSWQMNSTWLFTFISVNRGFGIAVTSLFQILYLWCNSHLHRNTLSVL